MSLMFQDLICQTASAEKKKILIIEIHVQYVRKIKFVAKTKMGLHVGFLFIL